MKKMIPFGLPVAFFSFAVSSLFFWLVIHGRIGCPGWLHGPWTLEQMAALKRRELSVFWIVVSGVPALSLGLRWLLTRFGNRLFPREIASSTEETSAASPPWTSWRSYRLLVCVLLPVILYFVAMEPMGAHPLEPIDEGLRVWAATQVQHGKKPYVDIYFQYGPGTEILQPLLAFSLFGNSLASQRRLERLVSPFGLIAAYVLCLVALRGNPLLLLFPLVLLGHDDAWISPRAALPLLALALVLSSRSPQHPRRRAVKLLIAGVLTVLALLYSMEGGLLVVPAIGLFYGFLWIERVQSTKRFRNSVLEEAGWFLGGIAMAMTPFLIWLTTIGGLHFFFENTFLMGSRVLSAFGKPTPILCEPLWSLVKNPFVLFSRAALWERWWFPMVLYLMTVTSALQSLFFERHDERHASLLLALAGIFFFVIALGRTDFEHWQKATPLFWIVAFVLIQEGIERWKGRNNSRGSRWMGLTIALFLGSFSLRFINPILLIDSFLPSRPTEPALDIRNATPEIKRLGAIRTSPAEIEESHAVVERLWRYAPPGASVFNFTDSAIYPYLADSVNPTRYALILFVVGQEMEDDVLRDLNRSRPACVIAVQSKSEIVCRPYHRRIRDYLLKNYRIADRYENFVFLIPNDSALTRNDQPASF